MKKIKYIIAVLILLTVTIFTVSADNKTLTYSYTYTTSCGTFHSITSTRQLSQGEIGNWHITCEFFKCGV